MISIGYGVGYIDVLSQVDGNPITIMIMLVLTFLMGLVSVFILYDVKQQHKNKLGSYQELIYFFTKDRSLVFLVSVIYLINYMNLSGYALNYSSKQICSFIYRFFFV